MAFTKTPTMDTYSQDTVSLFRDITLRDGGLSGKDEDYLNVFVEIIKDNKSGDGRRFIIKRAGTKEEIPSVSANKIRGIFEWPDAKKLYYAVQGNVYVRDLVSNTTTTLSSVFSTTTGEVGFCEFLYDDGTVKVITTDGTTLSTIDSSNTVVACTDVDLPAHLPQPIFLDGYLFVAEAGKANIHNCELNNPLSWTGTYIQTEMEADLINRIAKLNNYIVAFGKETIEYFWDAANEAPDSPLQRNDTPIKVNTYLGGFAQYGNTIYYIGSDMGGQPDVYMLKDFKIESLGNNSVSRYLNTTTTSYADWRGGVVSFQGHTFYVLNAGENKTWLLDVQSPLISRLAFKQLSTFPLLYSLNTISNSKVKTMFCLNENSSALYSFDETLYQDIGESFTCTITTEASSFGTLNRKTMGRAVILADRPPNDSSILVQWSDDDYKSFNSGVAVQLNQDLPSIRQLGSFRQRIFKLSYTDNYPLRLQDLEVNINKGNG